MPDTKHAPETKLVLDSERHPVGTVDADVLQAPDANRRLEVELSEGARQRLPTDADTIEIPLREIAAITRRGVRLTTTLRGLRARQRGPR